MIEGGGGAGFAPQPLEDSETLFAEATLAPPAAD
jgi:hypothetical protein